MTMTAREPALRVDSGMKSLYSGVPNSYTVPVVRGLAGCQVDEFEMGM